MNYKNICSWKKIVNKIDPTIEDLNKGMKKCIFLCDGYDKNCNVYIDYLDFKAKKSS